MKKLLLLTTVLLLTVSLTAPAQTPRKKVAVVLSGGGAKGMAHIGALRVIEKAGIPIDIITGTSMGSIVGGLYAIGYDSQKLDSLVRCQDWAFLLSDKADISRQSLQDRKDEHTYFLTKDINIGRHGVKSAGGMIQGKNLASLFSKLTAGYRDSIDFNTLPIPFACVATNIIDNTEYDFHSGILAEAMRTSMSIPGVFAPVRKGDMLLVDGGLRNNYPVDIARAMGADYVIGVTVQGPPKTADDLKNSAAVIGQIVDVNCKNKYDENMRNTDVLIRANTKGYSSASFTPAAIDTLIRRGEEEAMKHWDELLALKQKLGLPADYKHPHVTQLHETALPHRVKVNRLIFSDTEKGDENFLRQKYHLYGTDSIDVAKVDEIVASMRVDLFYNDADVYYNPVGDAYDINIVAKDKKSSNVKLGMRFDTEEMVAMQTKASFQFKTSKPLSAAMTLRLGKRIMARGDLSFTPIAFNKMMFSYIYRHNDINVYEGGDRAYNVTYNEHLLHLNVIDFNVRNFNIRIGARFDYYNFSDVLSGVQNESWEPLKDTHLLSYHADANYNSENEWYFPTRGTCVNMSFAYFTDNFAGYKGKRGFSTVSGMWRMNFAFTPRIALQPMVYGRLLFGSNVPAIQQNFIGGNWFDHYQEYQMPFAGVGYVEHTDNSFVGVQLRLQGRIATSHYVITKVALAQHADKLGNLLDHGPMHGYQIGYLYNSMLGPLGATLGYASKTKEVYFYINLGYEF